MLHQTQSSKTNITMDISRDKWKNGLADCIFNRRLPSSKWLDGPWEKEIIMDLHRSGLFFYAAVFIFRFIVVAVYFNRYSALDPGQNRFRDLVFKSCPKRRYDTTTLGPLVWNCDGQRVAHFLYIYHYKVDSRRVVENWFKGPICKSLFNKFSSLSLSLVSGENYVWNKTGSKKQPTDFTD